MTALFAYVAPGVAFIASDTCRAQGPFRSVAAKTLQWSDTVLLAQTGFGEGLQRLAGEMKAKQHLNPQGRTQQGLQQLFSSHRAYRLEFERHHAKAKSAVTGTLLAVQAGTLFGPEEIVTYDWVTGTSTPQSLPIYADGSDAVAFGQIAQHEFQSFPASSTPDLGAWAVRCMEAVMRNPKMDGVVGWPVDLSIIRRDQGCWIYVAQRIEAATTRRHPAFTL